MEHTIIEHAGQVPASPPALSGPLDLLLAEYRKTRADIERMAAYVADNAGAVTYFIAGAMQESRCSSISASGLFELEPAIRALDAAFWSRAMSLTDVLECMPAAKRNEWSRQIADHSTAPFEVDTVVDTLRTMLASREAYMAARVDGLFTVLSGDHVTNIPQGFAKRMIIAYMLDQWGSISSTRSEYVHDLRAVVAKFMGRDTPPRQQTANDLSAIVREGRFGEWVSFDGGAFKVRLFKKGTAHLEVHPDMAVRLNLILASLHPLAIPPQFRTASPKPQKTWAMRHDLVPFAVLSTLKKGRVSSDGQQISFYEPVGKVVGTVLEYLGGVPNGRSSWGFEYPVESVLAELQRSGLLPERVSHQFHPTGDWLGDRVVVLAEIGDEDSVLEPEAGMAALAKRLPVDRTTCVEISRLHCRVLEAYKFTTVCADFLEWNPGRLFDRIVMNPPFSEGRAIDHVRHAAALLSNRGRLVAILPASMMGKDVVDGLPHEWHGPYQDQFVTTGIVVAVLVLQKNS